MDTNTNFKISIPKPCHEDWNKFTPDEKGAFCKVCSKSVHDFTKKSAEEIKTVLIEEMSAGNKVCGRFNEDQLSPATKPIPDLNPYSLNFKKIKRFAMALFLVFGGFLFNSTKSTAQKIMGKMAMPQYNEPVKGEMRIRRDQVKDSAATIKNITPVEPKVPKCNSHLKGDVAVEPIEKITVLGGAVAMPIEEPTVKGNAIVQPTKGQVAIIETPPAVTGSVAISIEPEVIKNIEPTVIRDSVITAIETIEESQPMIMGMMVALPQHIETPLLIDPTPSDSIQNIIDGEFAVPESTYVETTEAQEIKVLPSNENLESNSLSLSSYPNPSSNGQITLRYDLKKDGMASILLYDLKGNLVKTFLASQSLYASSYENKYDVSDLGDGIYFCELVSGNNKTTTRIVISK